MQNSFLHASVNSACSGRIINMALGRASSGPAQMAGLDPARPHLKKKPKNFQKKPFKKNYDFLKYFSTHFA